MAKNVIEQIKLYKYNDKNYEALDEALEQYVKDVFSTISKENYAFFDEDMNPLTPEEVFKCSGDNLYYCYVGCKKVMDFLCACEVGDNFDDYGLWRWSDEKLTWINMNEEVELATGGQANIFYKVRF